MKTKINSIVRHLLTGASAWAVNSDLLSSAEADTVTSAVAAILAVVITRLILFALAKIKWAGLKDLLGDNKGVSSVLMMSLMLGMALGCATLTSCSQSLPVRGIISYKHVESGAKGGLVFEADKTPMGFVRVPIHDKVSGDINGWADVELGGAEVDGESGK